MYGLKRSKKDESGMIQGAGTGTSDSIQKDVPVGSYIMPADSTQKLGARNIKNLGQPSVPVNVSNGEYELPPEQVHAVGVQALNQMKDATHTTVPDQQGFGLKPELFFANGGVVPSSPYPSDDDIRYAQQNRLGGPQMRDVSGITRDVNRPMPSTNVNNTASTTPSTTSSPSASPTTPAPTQGGGFGARFNSLHQGINRAANTGLGKLGTVGALASTGFAVADTPTEQYRERFGLGDYNPEDSNGMLFAKDLGVRALGAASDLGNAMTFGQAGRFYADKQRIAQEAKAAQPGFNQQQNNNSKTIDNPFEKNTPPTQTQPPAPTQTQPTVRQNADPYAIQQKGNSFSYSNPAAAATAHANGVPELATSGFANVKPINDPRGVANMFANTREMGPSEQQIQNAIAQREASIGGGPRVYSLGSSSQAADNLQKRIDDVSQPLPGSRGLTASQRNQIVELQNGFDNRANDVYKTDANNAAALQREAMGQAGQNYRAELGEQGANSRFNANLGFDAQKFQATNDLANREFNLNATEKGFGIRNSARLEKLYEQYDSAKSDEDRKSIQEKINRYAGNKADTGNPYITVKRGEILDEKGNTIQPAGEVLFNRTTGQTIDPLAQMQQSNNLPNGMTRQVGTSNGKPVYEDAQGNRFIGN